MSKKREDKKRKYDNKEAEEAAMLRYSIGVGSSVKAFKHKQMDGSYEAAEVVEIRRVSNTPSLLDLVADIAWAEDGEISTGHLVSSLRKI